VIVDPPLLVAMMEVQRDQVVSALARLFADVLADCSAPARRAALRLQAQLDDSTSGP
jgi:hypothetical protein